MVPDLEQKLKTHTFVLMMTSKILGHNDVKPLITIGLAGCTAVVVISRYNDYATLYHCDPCLYTIENVVVNKGDIVYVKTPGEYHKFDDKYVFIVAQQAIKNQIAMWVKQSGRMHIRAYDMYMSIGEPAINRQMLIKSVDKEFIVTW